MIIVISCVWVRFKSHDLVQNPRYKRRPKTGIVNKISGNRHCWSTLIYHSTLSLNARVKLFFLNHLCRILNNLILLQNKQNIAEKEKGTREEGRPDLRWREAWAVSLEFPKCCTSGARVQVLCREDPSFSSTAESSSTISFLVVPDA